MASSIATIHRRNGYGDNAYTYYPIVIVGAGESGIAMGCRLKEVLGFDQFRIFDRQSGIGGTWYINRYPGIACDIPALFYSFSFSPKKDWTTLHPSGAEIFQYLIDVCAKYKIVDKIQLNTDVREIRWIEDEEEWEITLSHLVPGTGDLSLDARDSKVVIEGQRSVYVKTEVVRAKIVVSGVGGLVEPKKWPKEIPGIEAFEGDVIHTAKWNNTVDLEGKDVVVIGSGCSAAQVVPELVKPHINAKSVTQVMRSPPWVLPNLLPPASLKKWDKYSPPLMRNVPGLARVARNMLFCQLEFGWFQMFQDTGFARRNRRVIEKSCLDYMQRIVPEKYHEILTPTYSIGCKRRIVDGDWFRSLRSSNIELTTQPLTSVQSNSVTLGPGRHYPPLSQTDSKVPTDQARQIPADVIILANGYETSQWLHPLRVVGRGGRDLQEVWDERGGAQAYLGIAMDQFPNFFMIFGPNTATGHNSVIFASENMVNYSLKFMKPILDGHVSTYEVKEEAERKWTENLQSALKTTVFGSGGCRSWYKTEGGWNSNTYPYSQIDFYLRCTFPVWKHWTAKYTQKGIRIRRFRRILLVAILSGFFWTFKSQQGLQSWKQLIVGARDSILFVAVNSLARVRQFLA